MITDLDQSSIEYTLMQFEHVAERLVAEVKHKTDRRVRGERKGGRNDIHYVMALLVKLCVVKPSTDTFINESEVSNNYLIR